MFPKVPKKIILPDYPTGDNPFVSNRLIGTAKELDPYLFDQMNARIGPMKYVNVIFVGLGDVDSSYGKWLEAKWMGGKQNDVVVVWGGPNKEPTWVSAFGWTDVKLTLRNLETHILTNGAVNEALKGTQDIIYNDYKIKNWEDFDYISVSIPTGWVIGYAIFQIVTQVGLFYFYHNNEPSNRISRHRWTSR